MSKPLEITGIKFGLLTAIQKSDQRFGKGKQIKWICKCDCGKDYLVVPTQLSSGYTTSCGCDTNRKISEKNSTHGDTINGRTKEYRCWKSMKDRCFLKTSKSYHNYGGRGITISQRWVNSFENFLNDMGRAPSSIHQLERKYNNGNYEPSNCCWVIPMVQSRNRRTNVNATHNGKTMCALDWSNELGISRMKVLRRIKIGWSIQKIIDHYK